MVSRMVSGFDTSKSDPGLSNMRKKPVKEDISEYILSTTPDLDNGASRQQFSKSNQHTVEDASVRMSPEPQRSEKPENFLRSTQSPSPRPTAEARARWAMLASLAGLSKEEAASTKEELPMSTQEQEDGTKLIQPRRKSRSFDRIDVAGYTEMPDPEHFKAAVGEQRTSSIFSMEDDLDSISGMSNSSHSSNSLSRNDEFTHPGLPRTNTQHSMHVREILAKADEELKGISSAPREAAKYATNPVKAIGQDLETAATSIEKHVSELENQEYGVPSNGNSSVIQEISGAITGLVPRIESQVKSDIHNAVEELTRFSESSEINRLEVDLHQDAIRLGSEVENSISGMDSVERDMLQTLNRKIESIKPEEKTTGERGRSKEQSFVEDKITSATNDIKSVEVKAENALRKSVDRSRLSTLGGDLEGLVMEGEDMIGKVSRQMAQSRLNQRAPAETKDMARAASLDSAANTILDGRKDRSRLQKGDQQPEDHSHMSKTSNLAAETPNKMPIVGGITKVTGRPGKQPLNGFPPNSRPLISPAEAQRSQAGYPQRPVSPPQNSNVSNLDRLGAGQPATNLAEHQRDPSLIQNPKPSQESSNLPSQPRVFPQKSGARMSRLEEAPSNALSSPKSQGRQVDSSRSLKIAQSSAPPFQRPSAQHMQSRADRGKLLNHAPQLEPKRGHQDPHFHEMLQQDHSERRRSGGLEDNKRGPEVKEQVPNTLLRSRHGAPAMRQQTYSKNIAIETPNDMTTSTGKEDSLVGMSRAIQKQPDQYQPTSLQRMDANANGTEATHGLSQMLHHGSKHPGVKGRIPNGVRASPETLSGPLSCRHSEAVAAKRSQLPSTDPSGIRDASHASSQTRSQRELPAKDVAMLHDTHLRSVSSFEPSLISPPQPLEPSEANCRPQLPHSSQLPQAHTAAHFDPSQVQAYINNLKQQASTMSSGSCPGFMERKYNPLFAV